MKTSLLNSDKLFLIAGPCALESTAIANEVARVLKDLQDRYADDLTIVFKSSFDKANRTCVNGMRGVGLKEGLEILSQIKSDYRLPVITDIHLPEQAAIVSSTCDALQIPAFLCRQTDLLKAAAQTKLPVNVKKGQFLAPMDMKFVVQKLEAFGATEIWQTERGTTFGYGNLVVDMRTFPILKANGHPTLFDATHSLQMPGIGSEFTHGDCQYAETLAKAALAAGAQGIYIETHPNPSEAISDKQIQTPLAQLPSFVDHCLSLWKFLNK